MAFNVLNQSIQISKNNKYIKGIYLLLRIELKYPLFELKSFYQLDWLNEK